MGPFETDDASDIVGTITSTLEAELVSFVHRVKFTYAMHYDRARAAVVMLTALAKSGVPWAPPEDATVPLIERTFATYFQKVTFEPDLRRAIEADLAELARVYADPDDVASAPTEEEVHGALRAIGAEPAACQWASAYDVEFGEAWSHSASPPRRTPQIALAAGVDHARVTCAIADAMWSEASATKGSLLDVRDDLLAVLEALAAGDASSRSMSERIERLRGANEAAAEAFMESMRERPGDPSDEDPLRDLLAQAVELIRMRDAATALGALDPYWAGDVVEKLVRDARSVDVLQIVRAKLEPAVLAAARQREEALGDG